MIIAWQNSGTPIQRFNMLMTKTNGQKGLIWTQLKLTSSHSNVILLRNVTH